MLCAASTEYTSSRRGQWIRKIPGVIAFGSGDDDAPARICVSDGDSIAHTTALSKWRRNDDRIVRVEAKQNNNNNNNNIEAKRFSSNLLAKRFVRIGGQSGSTAR